MSTGSNEQSGGNFPAPSGEQGPVFSAAGETDFDLAEHAPIASEKAPIQGHAAPPISLPLPQNSVPQVAQTVVPPTPTNVVSNVSDDDDLIESEWVEMAKRIVESTRDDPHQQSEQLTVFKADYLKKRFDKTLKTGK